MVIDNSRFFKDFFFLFMDISGAFVFSNVKSIFEDTVLSQNTEESCSCFRQLLLELLLSWGFRISIQNNDREGQEVGCVSSALFDVCEAS